MIKKFIVMVVSTIMLLAPIGAQAGMADSNSVLEQPATTVFDMDALAAQMAALGVTEQQLQDRLATMTEAEQAQLANNLNNLPAGQDVLSLAFTIFLVFMVTDMMGATDVFTFVNEL